MITLQFIDIFNPAQLTSILLLLVIGTTVIALAIIVVTFLTSPKTISGDVFSEGREALSAEDEGIVARTRTPLIDKYATNVLNYLSSTEAINIENIMSHLPGDKETINTVITKLREDGIIELSGGVIMLTEKGKKMIEILKEKYWFKDLEKHQE